MIDLLRLSRSKGFTPGDQPLYRQIAKLAGLSSDDSDALKSLVDVPCGQGAVAEFFAQSYPVEVAGVDPDPELIEVAERRARDTELTTQLQFQSASVDDLPFQDEVFDLSQFQSASVDDLPFQDEVFDLSIGELGLASSTDPFRAVAELCRVTRPSGTVVLIGLIWTGHVDDEQRRILIEHIGAPPQMLVEWKQALREAKVEDLHVEDWSDHAFPFLVRGRTFTHLAELSTLADKVSILQRAWQRWGLRGLRGALSREYEIRKLLGPERTIGVTLITGTKAGAVRAEAQRNE
ncbi:MAG: hypothetical protein AMS25_19295 [Gemmatimonas sp. SM23_52]|nr:MAG: hypothetical protein AMS25_19295 [Gemmatimonas sp. SM23_52]